MFGTAVSVRSLTVSLTGPDRGFGHRDFSALWDFHLVHDRRVAPDTRAATEDAADGNTLALCAAVALCAAGGWSGSTAGIDLDDRADGPVKHPRVVHAQQRVLYAPDLTFLGMPSSPPWPTPKSAGVRPALPGSMPPVHVARRLARQCHFECVLAQATDASPDNGPGLWDCLFGPLSETLPRTEGELALGRLAKRTGGYKARRADGMVPLSLEGLTGRQDVAELVRHIKRSSFPIGAHSAGAEGATPETWQTVRGAFFALVDGSEMPAGVPAAPNGQGHDGKVLVWPDPLALAPPRAPGSPAPAYGETDASAEAADSAAPEPADQPDIVKQKPAAPSADAESALPDSQYRLKLSSPQKQESPQSDSRDESRPEEDTAVPSEWLTQDEDTLPTGGDHDTLMSRLGASIDGAIARAHRNFRRYAAARPPGDEYQQARARRRQARGLLAVGGLALAMVIAGAMDQRWPYLAVTWEAATPWQAHPWYGPAVWPVGWLVLGLVVALLGLRILSGAAARLRMAVRDLREGERLRHEFTMNSAHYASQLMRLHSLSEQFVDHRRIITELLHRPFGDPELSARNQLDAEALRFDATPPPSMLVGAANASDQRVDDEQRKLRMRMMKRGWLTSVYRDVLGAWSTRYERRVLEEPPDPDSDASIPGTVRHRDARDGSEVLGPREDFARAVASDGWALAEARRARWTQSLTDGSDDNSVAIERYLALLEAPVAVHGPVYVATDAADFLNLRPAGEELSANQAQHRFSWAEMLRPSAAAQPPAISAVSSGDLPLVAPTDSANAMVLMSWRLEYSEPVRADDLRGWADASSDQAAPLSKEGVI